MHCFLLNRYPFEMCGCSRLYWVVGCHECHCQLTPWTTYQYHLMFLLFYFLSRVQPHPRIRSLRDDSILIQSYGLSYSCFCSHTDLDMNTLMPSPYRAAFMFITSYNVSGSRIRDFRSHAILVY